MSKECFDRLEVKYGTFSLDYFASDWAHRMYPFVSKYLTRGAEYRDAFTVDWSEGIGYFHPPVGEVARVIEKAKNERVRGILLVPDWPGSEVVSIVERETEYLSLRAQAG